MTLSIIVPVYNEEQNIDLLYEAILKSLKDVKRPWELILVDDGSRDNSLEKLRALVDQGHLGRKSGQGFYAWKGGKALKPTPAGEAPVHDPDISDRLILRLVNESVACLREGVVDDEDLLDAGVIFGTGFAPFRGGPMHYVHSRGSAEVKQRLDELEDRFGQHFHADPGWGAIA